MLIGSYRQSARRPGIPVAPVGMTVFCDLIMLAGGTFFVALAIDTMWVGWLGQPSLVGLEPDWPYWMHPGR